MKLLGIVFLLFATLHVFGQDKKLLAPTPPMGWNSWNWFGKMEINEKNMKECMDAIVTEGLLDAGYNYFVIDGGWRDTKLGPNGELLAHPEKFPHGMKVMADYAHSKGLKFGLHTVPGTHDCGGDPVGGFGHEEIQVKQFVDWGLDFIKLDKCKYADGWNEELLKQTYTKWHGLLNNCGRDIVFSISAYTWRGWYPANCDMARSTQDIKFRMSKGAVFNSPERENKGLLTVMAISEFNNLSAKAAGNGFWNDPDMLVTGEQGLTLDEQKAHFALWCIMSAPLFLGNDPRKMIGEEKEIIMNKMAIAIDQDPTEQGRRIKVEGDTEIWAKQLKDGKLAVLVLNKNNSERINFILKLSEIGIAGKTKIKSVYTGKKVLASEGKISVEILPHASIFMLIEQRDK